MRSTMPSTFFGLNIGSTGLYTYKSALNTTAHNIANTETKGYTRQVLGQQADKALRVNNTYGMAGTGVVVTGVTQMRNQYYDMKFWTNNTLNGEYSIKGHYMTELQNYFNDVTLDGFTVTFNSMYDSLQELSKNPSSLAVRNQVINYGKTLAEYFNSLATSVKRIQEDCNFEINNKVNQINSIAQQIATLTKQINTLEVGGGVACDIRDQRALLIDELSEIVNVSVTEKTVGDGVGVNSYVVKINGQTLVDTSEYNTLKTVSREHKVNQNDIDGLYYVVWEKSGQIFDTYSSSLGGSLQALFEIRDGNNAHNLKGSVTAIAGEETLVMSNCNINSEEMLNIPESGVITVDNREYVYNGFEVKIGADGKYTSFSLDQPVEVSVTNVSAAIGKSVNYKGIPFYMAKLNEFVRCFARAFNEVHREGEDLEARDGIDFFNATHKVSGRNYTFGPLKSSADYPTYDFTTFSSQTGAYEVVVPDDKPLYGSYYFMTADNFTITKELMDDPSYFAAAAGEPEGEPDNGFLDHGVEDNTIVDKLIALKSDKSMFRQGPPDAFFQTLVADLGIDTKKAMNFSINQRNILESITNQRLSVSGVDIDEEAMSLVRYQNAYNLSAKVISVMDEIYDKLINYMGV